MNHGVITQNYIQKMPIPMHKPQVGSLPDTFYIDRIDVKDCLNIEQIAKEWHTLALKKIGCLSQQSASYSRLVACYSVVQMIALNCEIFRKNPKRTEELGMNIYVCKDGEDRICGIAIVAIKSCAIVGQYLVTHPDRLDEGVGRKFCETMEKMAQEAGWESVNFKPLGSALPFYKKMGFQGSSVEMSKTFSKL